ncbi:hypothetical protein [Pseudarthrobacter oxydans]|nr:hypothetical protein [Pseudarthrobacter oxydans]WPU08087.1 hypothetical protein SMD14_13025 [Pseudarthrobacter oxydans]
MTDEEIREALDDCPDQRTAARRAAKWIDVLAHRASPESSYVPMGGGKR